MVLRVLSLIVLFSLLTLPSVGRADDKLAKKTARTGHECCVENPDGKSAMDCKDLAATKEGGSCSDVKKSAMNCKDMVTHEDGKSCSEMENTAPKTKDAGKMDCCSEHGKVKNQKVKSAEPKGTK